MSSKPCTEHSNKCHDVNDRNALGGLPDNAPGYGDCLEDRSDPEAERP